MIQDVKKIYLCTPDLRIRTVLNGVQTDSVNFNQRVKDFDELTFTVDRYILADGVQVESNGYDDLKVYMYLYLEDIGYFQIQEPTVNNDSNHETKDIQAYSCEKEFEQKDWLGFKVNNGEDDSLEMLATDNLDELGFAKEFVVFFRPDNPELSFLNLILSKIPYWTVGYVDETIWNKVIPLMSIDNANLYSLMTSSVAPRLGLIFDFDYMNRMVNVYHKDHIDIDTNIFIGFRNLANEVNISVNEDSVYTRFRVRGENDLKFTNINYGNDQCIDLSYFLGEPYMDDALADKVRFWLDQRDDQREDLIEQEKNAAEANARIDSLQYRVPSDETYWRGWDNMSLEALQDNLGVQRARLAALQTSVDTRPVEEQFDANGNYVPVQTEGGVDHSYYLNLLWNYENGCGGYFAYKEIITYIIPYIQQAILNINAPKEQKIRYGTESEEDWSLYGYYELEGKRKNYEEDKLPALNKFSKPWDELSEDEQLGYVNEDGYRMQGRDDYEHIVAELGDKNTPGTIYYYLDQLEKEIADEERKLKLYQSRIRHFVEYNQLETAKGRTGQNLFTEDEIKYIKTLLIDTDYTNSNILATSLDTVVTMIDREKELYDDAMEKLSEVSQPQYEFTCDLDNLIRIPEFQDWVEDLRLMRFIRLGIRDDYSVKLRIIEIEYNPCEVDPNLRLTFSSMITSRSGRNDLTQIIDDENYRGSKNSISIGTGNSKKDTDYVNTLLTLMTKSGLFTTAVRNIASDLTGGTDNIAVNNLIDTYMWNTKYPISHITGTNEQWTGLLLDNLTADAITAALLQAEEGNFDQVLTKYLSAEEITTKLINAEQGNFDQVLTKYLSADEITTKLINAEEGNFDQVITKYLSADEITTKLINAEEGNFDQVITKYLDADTVVAKLISADDADFGTVSSRVMNTGYLNASHITGDSGDFDTLAANVLDAGSATIDTLMSNKISSSQIDVGQITGNYANFAELLAPYIEAGTVTADAVITSLLSAEDADLERLTAESAFIQYLNSTLIVASEIKVDDLQAKLAQIDTLEANTAFVNYLQNLSSTTAKATIDAAYVSDIVAGNISVGDLKAGDITISDSMRIKSANGALIMNGTALQIIGKDSNNQSYVGVQLGYDTQDNPSLILRNQSGATVLTPEGITANAIADELIQNDMIKTGTISEDKLSFNVMKEGDTISIEKVMLGDGSFGVDYSTFKTGTDSALQQMKQDIEDAASYDLFIETPNGTNIWYGSIQLKVKLLKNNVDVTDEFDSEYFTWTRTSQDYYGDIYWNTNHSNGTKSIIITSNDVKVNADFQCKFEYENITVVSSD